MFILYIFCFNYNMSKRSLLNIFYDENNLIQNWKDKMLFLYFTCTLPFNNSQMNSMNSNTNLHWHKLMSRAWATFIEKPKNYFYFHSTFHHNIIFICVGTVYIPIFSGNRERGVSMGSPPPIWPIKVSIFFIG